VIDEAVSAWLQANAHPALTRVLLVVTYAHNTVGLLLGGAVLGFVLWRRGLRGEALALAVALPGVMLLNVGLKHIFQRARPAWPDPVLVLDTYSFPSGHAAGSAALYGFVAALALRHLKQAEQRVAAVAVCAFMVALVCFSRVYLGVHYPSDVVVGAAVGLLGLWVCRRAFAQHLSR
jgi:membrane-associated phospholipid phosphatase